MKNLKRVLSLGLASVMLVGMMVVGAGAADFTDVEDIAHTEAVNTLVALNIINGKPDGSFDPNGDVTRAEMAKMIAVAMNGGSEETVGVKTVPTFTDISTSWAQPYIEYCADLGIISGRGDGTFDPEGKVTGTEATKMVLSALGYDADAYKLTGAQWAVRTDELARTADPTLYEDLAGVSMNAPASRDTAAQLIWNGLQNNTRRISPSQNKNNGEVTWDYETGDMLLYERYGAYIYVGTYAGNTDTGAASVDGEIKIENGHAEGFYTTGGALAYQGDVTFPSDMGIENIGEEIKVIFKDGNNTLSKGKPDGRDKIYGVFNTGATQVIWASLSDIKTGDDSPSAMNRVKIGSSEYGVAAPVSGTTPAYAGTTVLVEYNFNSGVQLTASEVASGNAADGKTAVTYKAGNTKIVSGTHATTNECVALAKAAFESLKENDSLSQVKFVCDNDGQIAKAYVVETKAGRVSSLTSSKITITGVGTFDLEDVEAYEDIAKDDVVTYSKYYSANNSNAKLIVKATTDVEGELTGYKIDGGTYRNVVIDGDSYNVAVRPANIPNLTDDAMTALTDKNIGDTVKAYLSENNKLVALQSIEASGGSYAVITDNNVTSTSAKIDSDLDPVKVTVMDQDGTKTTYVVHEDSTYDGKNPINDKATGSAGSKVDELAKQNLVEYSVSGGKIKIKNVSKPVAITGTGSSGKDDVWDKDTKALTYTAKKTAVAAADAVAYVYVNGDNKFYAFDLRGLGSIANDNDGVEVAYFLNDDNQIAACFVNAATKPGSSTADTLYGYVTGYVGTRTNGDSEKLEVYKVAVNRDEEVEIALTSNNHASSAIKAGQLVSFDESNNGEYKQSTSGTDFTVIRGAKAASEADGYSSTLTDGKWTAVAVNKFENNILSYFQNTTQAAAGDAFVGSNGGSVAVDKDVKIVYIDMDAEEDGDDMGVSGFSTATGLANVMVHMNDGVVDVIIVNTAEKPDMAANTDDAGNFGKKLNGGKASDNVADKTKAAADITDGVYTVADKNFGSDKPLTSNADAEDLICIKFTAKGSTKYTVKIGTTYGADDVYSESDTVGTAGAAVCYIDKTGTHIKSGATGTLGRDKVALSSGTTYYVQVVEDPDDTPAVVVTTTFTI